MKYFAAIGIAVLFIAAASVGPWAPSPFTSQTGTNTTAAAWRTALGAASTTTLSGYVTNHTGAATNLSITGGSVAGQTNTDLTASRVMVSSSAKVPASSSATATEAGYLSGVTSAIQTQLDSKPTVALTNLALLNASQTFTGTNTFTNDANTFKGAAYGSAQQTLAYVSGTNITVDASRVLHFVTLTNTTYFAQPSNLAVGASFTVHLMQDATGVRSVTFNTNYWRFAGSLQPAITTNANSYSVLSCVADPFGTNVFVVPALNFQ